MAPRGSPGDPLTVIACEGVWIVALSKRVDDGSWVVTLDRHRNGLGGLAPLQQLRPGPRWRRALGGKARGSIAGGRGQDHGLACSCAGKQAGQGKH